MWQQIYATCNPLSHQAHLTTAEFLSSATEHACMFTHALWLMLDICMSLLLPLVAQSVCFHCMWGLPQDSKLCGNADFSRVDLKFRRQCHEPQRPDGNFSRTEIPINC